MLTYLAGLLTGLFGPALVRHFSGPLGRRLARLVRSHLNSGRG